MVDDEGSPALASAFDSPTFGHDGSFRLDEPVGSASISPCGRDIVLASRQGLHIIDLDLPWSPPRHLPHYTPWEVADVQWSPFASRDYWVVSTSNQKALVWNLGITHSRTAVEHVLHGHSRAITDINFSAHHPDALATCAVDAFVHCWDLRRPQTPAISFCDWFAGATQVKWNRQNPHILASSHDKFLRIWDDRKGAVPLRSIKGHATKIYGVDWNRTIPTKIATCSLDMTIKFWDYTNSTDEPDQTLHTPFPVWRARHTPFGSGILAMPQRGNSDLHLYNYNSDVSEVTEGVVPPSHRFAGHEGQVKEFLWRPRGSVAEGIDNREFQLVSWGTDRVLRLHHINDKTLESVGHATCGPANQVLNITRKNAAYKTFRVNPSLHEDEPFDKDVTTRAAREEDTGITGTRSALSNGMSRAPYVESNGWANGGAMVSMVGQKSKASREMDALTWMRGVKIGKRDSGARPIRESAPSMMLPDSGGEVFETLGEEVSHVGDKFAKVRFYEASKAKRFDFPC